MANLLLCSDCTRFFRAGEALCPFCGASVARASQRGRAPLPAGASRSRCYAARLAVVATAASLACTDDAETSSNGAETELSETPTDGEGATGSSTDGTSSDGTDEEETDEHDSTDEEETDEHDITDGEVDGDDTDAERTDSRATDDDTTDAESTNTDDRGLAGAGGMACPGYPERDLALYTTCTTVQDCIDSGAGSVCAQERIFQTLPNNPCRGFFDYCEPDCSGQCVPAECGETCVPLCDEATCSGTLHCIDDVTCAQKPCDMDGAAECGPGFHCAPELPFADGRGCAVLSCDEDGALECPAGTRCDPEGEFASNQGCVPIRCDEPGGPECGQGTVCRPDSPFAQSGVNRQGCAPVRCDEADGPECGAESYCNPGSETSANGCDFIPCDAGWDCAPWRECALGSIGADVHGCIDTPCTEHTDCGCGYCFDGACSPTEGICVVPEIVATPYGCVWPDDEFV